MALGRVAIPQVRWTPGIGSEPGLASAFMVQQAVRLRRPLYFMYIDLSQFFSSIDRACLIVAELAVGIPEEVRRLTLDIYGERAVE